MTFLSDTAKVIYWLALFGSFAYVTMSDILHSPVWKRALSLIVMLALVILVCEFLIPPVE